MARRPRMAKMLLVSTMNGSLVMAKMAGMLSTAKITSVRPTSAITISSGVAKRLPFSTVKNFSPSKFLLTGSSLRSSFKAGLLSKSGSLPAAHHILMPVSSKKAPNRYSTQWNSLISQLPRRIITVRSTMTPTMPIISTRFWNSGGTAK